MLQERLGLEKYVTAQMYYSLVGRGLEVSSSLEGRLMLVSTAIAFVGIGLAKMFFGGGVREPARRFVAALPRLVAAVRGKFFVDEIYDWLVVRPLHGLARGFFVAVDRERPRPGGRGPPTAIRAWEDPEAG